MCFKFEAQQEIQRIYVLNENRIHCACCSSSKPNAAHLVNPREPYNSISVDLHKEKIPPDDSTGQGKYDPVYLLYFCIQEAVIKDQSSRNTDVLSIFRDSNPCICFKPNLPKGSIKYIQPQTIISFPDSKVKFIKEVSFSSSTKASQTQETLLRIPLLV